MMDSIKQDLKVAVEEEEDQYEKDMKLQVEKKEKSNDWNSELLLFWLKR